MKLTRAVSIAAVLDKVVTVTTSLAFYIIALEQKKIDADAFCAKSIFV